LEDKTKLLIIDDEEDTCIFAKSILEKTGRYEVIFSTKAKEGINLAKSHRLDLILLDVRMPDMDGAEVAQHLSEDEATQAITIVFLTALAIPMAFLVSLLENETLKQETKQGDGYYFIQKPVTAKELVERLDSILNDKR
jgi:ribose transport system substrate-binding protein